ncbi:MAG: M50 family metallopeptidase [Methanoregulaceae archaeon]|nr:M50 family metallopeptidase [Methanoregulaceae archaeon]
MSWVLPILALLTLPLQYVYTHLHEAGHALAFVASGGTGVTVRVFQDGSGVTTGFGGNPLLVSSAGYVGATAFGALVIALAHNERGARAALLTMAWVLGGAMVLWVRGDLVGLLSGIIGVAVLALAGTKLKGDARLFAAQFFGLFMGLASLQAVFATLRIGQVALEMNDAEILQGLTGIPAIISAVIWSAISLCLVILALRRSWSA